MVNRVVVFERRAVPQLGIPRAPGGTNFLFADPDRPPGSGFLSPDRFCLALLIVDENVDQEAYPAGGCTQKTQYGQSRITHELEGSFHAHQQ